jgi:hypothetical protein
LSHAADRFAVDPARRLPAELLFLLHRHPRASWRDGDGLGELGRFWLERHQMFRRLAAEITQGITLLREGRQAPEGFAAWLVPRLRTYLAELDGHHRIEDAHYFPAFREAEPRLVAGFDLLERDHHALEAALEAVARSGQAFLRGLGPDRPLPMREAEAHLDAVGRLTRSLDRHLDDEEDLVMPLLLAHGAG